MCLGRLSATVLLLTGCANLSGLSGGGADGGSADTLGTVADAPAPNADANVPETHPADVDIPETRPADAAAPDGPADARAASSDATPPTCSANVNATCLTDADCCGNNGLPLACTGGVCCVGHLGHCGNTTECCAGMGLVCNRGSSPGPDNACVVCGDAGGCM